MKGVNVRSNLVALLMSEGDVAFPPLVREKKAHHVPTAPECLKFAVSPPKIDT